MTLHRNLRLGSAGEDVFALKRRLLELGMYAAHIQQVTHDRFGRDTKNELLAFQRKNGLEMDGVAGALTWGMLFPDEAEAVLPPVPTEGIPAQISALRAERIARSLEGESALRRAIVLDALSFAYDCNAPRSLPLSLYIRGANLYDTSLKPYVITLSRIASGARRQPEYYDGGRREMMERAVRENPAITGADCSGGVVGLMRHAGVVSNGFDCSADGFFASSRMKHIDKSALRPADLVHKSGHIGLYAGGGYVVEWMGGAYGCQLTELDARRGWNFVSGKTAKMGAWTGFLRPSYY